MLPRISNNFTGQTLIYSVSILIERIASMFLLPVLTKYLSPAMYGVWSQIVVSIGLMAPIATVGFGTAIVNFLSGTKGELKRTLFMGSFLIVLGNLLIMCVVGWAFSDQISDIIFGSKEYGFFAKVFLLMLAADTVYQILTSYLRANEKIILLSKYMIFKNASRVTIFLLAFYFFSLNFKAAIIGLLSFQILLVVYIYLKDIANNDKLVWADSRFKKKFREMLFFALPLLPYAALVWLNNFIDRYMVLYFLDIDHLAVYSASYSIAAIVGIFYSILGFTLYPYIASIWNREDGNMEAVSKALLGGVSYYLFCSVPLVLLFTIYHKEIVLILTSSSYVTRWMVIFWLSSGILLFGLYSIYLYVLLLQKKIKTILIVLSVSVVAKVLVNLITIPSYGIGGAAFSTVVANLILVAVVAFMVKRVIKHIFSIRGLLRILMASSVMCVAALIAGQLLIGEVFVGDFWRAAISLSIGAIVYLAFDLLVPGSYIKRMWHSLCA